MPSSPECPMQLVLSVCLEYQQYMHNSDIKKAFLCLESILIWHFIDIFGYQWHGTFFMLKQAELTKKDHEKINSVFYWCTSVHSNATGARLLEFCCS